MNERIKLLAAQAGIQKDLVDNIKDEVLTYIARPQDLEKFLTMIVLECSKHIRDRAMQAGGACTIVGEAEFWIADDLEKHFGVKE